MQTWIETKMRRACRAIWRHAPQYMQQRENDAHGFFAALRASFSTAEKISMPRFFGMRATRVSEAFFSRAPFSFSCLLDTFDVLLQPHYA